MSGHDLLAFSVFFIAASAAAAPGVIFRPGEWYRALDKPRWCPPNWLFAPVWTVLYLGIAVSGWLVWREVGTSAPMALAVYGVHLAFNALWSVVFFGLRRPGWAMLEIVALWVGIVATIAVFASIDTVAAAILVPYLLWVSFAAALNFSLWRRNREGVAPI